MPTCFGPIEGISLIGSAVAFPRMHLTNQDVFRLLAKQFWPEAEPPSEERLEFLSSGIETTLGVRERHWAHVPGTPFDHETEESTLDLGAVAGKAALEDAGVAPTDLCLVICSTSTPSKMTSTLSAVIGARLQTDAACMDLRTGCSAGLFGLATAALFVSQTQRPALIIGTETFSKVLPPNFKPAALTMADGAGALVIAPGNGKLRAISLSTDGKLAHLVSAPGPLPPTHEDVAAGKFFLHGSPEELGAELPLKYQNAIQEVLSHSKLSAKEISRYVPHQTSPHLIASVAASAGIPNERCFVNVARHANVGAAGWMVAVHEARKERTLVARETMLIASVGGGMSWAAAILEI